MFALRVYKYLDSTKNRICKGIAIGWRSVASATELNDNPQRLARLDLKCLSTEVPITQPLALEEHDNHYVMDPGFASRLASYPLRMLRYNVRQVFLGPGTNMPIQTICSANRWASVESVSLYPSPRGVHALFERNGEDSISAVLNIPKQGVFIA